MDPVAALFWSSGDNARLRSLRLSSLQPLRQKHQEYRRRLAEAVPHFRSPSLTQTAGTSSTRASPRSPAAWTRASSFLSTCVRRTRRRRPSSRRTTSRCERVIKVRYCANLVDSPEEYEQLFLYYVAAAEQSTKIYDLVRAKNKLVSCEQRLCTEIRALNLAGVCSGLG